MCSMRLQCHVLCMSLVLCYLNKNILANISFQPYLVNEFFVSNFLAILLRYLGIYVMISKLYWTKPHEYVQFCSCSELAEGLISLSLRRVHTGNLLLELPASASLQYLVMSSPSWSMFTQTSVLFLLVWPAIPATGHWSPAGTCISCEFQLQTATCKLDCRLALVVCLIFTLEVNALNTSWCHCEVIPV